VSNFTCHFCRETFNKPTGKGITPKYCSKSCVNAANNERRRLAGSRGNYVHKCNCPICGNDFMGKSKQVYCSKQCQLDSCREQALAASHNYYKERARDKRAVEIYSGPPSPRPTWSGTVIEGTRTFASGPCNWCGEQFTDKWAVARYCSRACGDRADNHRTWSRRGYFKPTPTLRKQVALASNWACHLCRLPIPPDVPHQNPFALTLDHVVPQSLAEVPDHTPANLRAAHRQCNSVRGNKPINSPTFYQDALTSMMQRRIAAA
jgi:5-methylcytosine-specific restriction endonuclease McrA